MADPVPEARYDAVVIGAGPAGLSAALNLVRGRRRTLIVDGNRPRNAATLRSHGFTTRDGVSPLELRRLGREEVESYPEAEFQLGMVRSIDAGGAETGDRHSSVSGFRVRIAGMRGSATRTVEARTVVIATGLIERLPALPSIRAFYGTHLHSCIDCDGYEESGKPLALIGETDDLAEHALLVAQWTDDLIVFTNAVGTVTEEEERALSARGIPVERRRISDLVGDRDMLTGVALEDGTVIARTGGFVRPEYDPALGYAADLAMSVDASGLVIIDLDGRASVPGVYVAGDAAIPGPQQLIVAAGAGARVAAALNRDLALRWRQLR